MRICGVDQIENKTILWLDFFPSRVLLFALCSALGSQGMWSPLRGGWKAPGCGELPLWRSLHLCAQNEADLNGDLFVCNVQ